MAEVYSFRECAELLGRNPGPGLPVPEPEMEEVVLEPPPVFKPVDSTAMGVSHELKSVEVHALEPPELEMRSESR